MIDGSPGVLATDGDSKDGEGVTAAIPSSLAVVAANKAYRVVDAVLVILLLLLSAAACEGVLVLVLVFASAKTAATA
jgi:hypothetical protein